MHAKAELTIATLWDAVGPILQLFTHTEGPNYLRAAAYEPD